MDGTALSYTIIPSSPLPKPRTPTVASATPRVARTPNAILSWRRWCVSHPRRRGVGHKLHPYGRTRVWIHCTPCKTVLFASVASLKWFVSTFDWLFSNSYVNEVSNGHRMPTSSYLAMSRYPVNWAFSVLGTELFATQQLGYWERRASTSCPFMQTNKIRPHRLGCGYVWTQRTNNHYIKRWPGSSPTGRDFFWGRVKFRHAQTFRQSIFSTLFTRG